MFLSGSFYSKNTKILWWKSPSEGRELTDMGRSKQRLFKNNFASCRILGIFKVKAKIIVQRHEVPCGLSGDLKMCDLEWPLNAVLCWSLFSACFRRQLTVRRRRRWSLYYWLRLSCSSVVCGGLITKMLLVTLIVCWRLCVMIGGRCSNVARFHVLFDLHFALMVWVWRMSASCLYFSFFFLFLHTF